MAQSAAVLIFLTLAWVVLPCALLFTASALYSATKEEGESE